MQGLRSDVYDNALRRAAVEHVIQDVIGPHAGEEPMTRERLGSLLAPFRTKKVDIDGQSVFLWHAAEAAAFGTRHGKGNLITAVLAKLAENSEQQVGADSEAAKLAENSEQQVGADSEAAETSDSESVSSTSSDSVESIDIVPGFSPVAATPAGHLHFEKGRYRKDADRCPPELMSRIDDIAGVVGFRDQALWRSLMYFFVLMLAMQPLCLFTDVVDEASPTRDLAKAVFDGAPLLHQYVVKEGLRMGQLPYFDAALRTRSVQSIGMFSELHGSALVTGPSLAAWIFFDMVFRYIGEYTIISDNFLLGPFAQQTRQLVKDGLSPDNAASFGEKAKMLLASILETRSDVAATNNIGDGRKQWVRGREVDFVAPKRYRPIDHLLDAMPGWVAPSAKVGPMLHDLLRLLQGSELDMEIAERRFELIMLELLRFELLGRPTFPGNLPFHLRILVYAIKFPLSDIFCMMHACLCSKLDRDYDLQPVTGFDIRCGCVQCTRVMHLRQRYIYFGPAPRALHASLVRQKVGRTSVEETTYGTWKRMLSLLNAKFAVCLCLYTLQMLGCSWRRFIRLCARGKKAPVSRWIGLCQLSRHRDLQVSLYRAETQLLRIALCWLENFSLLAQFMQLPAHARRALVHRVTWSLSTTREDVIQAFEAAGAEATPHGCPSFSSDFFEQAQAERKRENAARVLRKRENAERKRAKTHAR